MKRSKVSLVALILGLIAAGILASVLFGSNAKDSAEAVGESIGKAIVMPSAFAMFVAVILNAVGYFTNNRTVTLISAIMYILSLILMPLWGFVGIPSMILQFIAYSKMKKI